MNLFISFHISSELKDFLESITNFQAIEFHQSSSKRQRAVYNLRRQDKEFLRDNLLIDMDFKAKILIGKLIR